jgi:hypothetical protein
MPENKPPAVAGVIASSMMTDNPQNVSLSIKSVT